MTADEIRAIEVSPDPLIEMLLREIAAQLAEINAHLAAMFDDQGEGLLVKVDARYNDKGDGLRVVLVKEDEGEED